MAFDLIRELIDTYKAPPQKMLQMMERLAQSIPESAREDVYNAILEELGPNYQVGYNSIIDACKKLGVPYSATHFIPAENWVCDACGNNFRYHPCPDEDDKIDKRIYDTCPDCGMQPYWTIIAGKYKAMGIATPWYDKLLSEARDFGPNKPAKVVKKNGMTLNRGGVFWARARAESERADDKRISVAAKMAEIDRSKRYDLKSD